MARLLLDTHVLPWSLAEPASRIRLYGIPVRWRRSSSVPFASLGRRPAGRTRRSARVVLA